MLLRSRVEHAPLGCYYRLQPRRDHAREPQLEAVASEHLGQVAPEVKIGLFCLLIKRGRVAGGGGVEGLTINECSLI